VIVISNTTPIISLASINRLDLLEKMFSKIVIPEAVYNEIKAKQHYGYSEIDNAFIEVQKITGYLYKDFLLKELDAGEAETIILAKEMNADFVIIDESLGYKIANNVGLTAIRTLSVLLKAKEKGYIFQLKPLLDQMINNGRWYSNNVYQAILMQANE